MQSYTNKFNLPIPLALWLAVDEYKGNSEDNEISATGLLKSPRYILSQLRQRFPEKFPEHLRPVPVETIELPDIQEKVAARIGTAIHSSVELAWKEYYQQGLMALGASEKQLESVSINSEGNIPVYLENRLYKQIEVSGVTFTISGQYDMVVDGNLHDIKTTSTYSYENGCNDLKYTKQGSIYRWLNPELITGDKLTINFLFLDWKQFMDNKNNNYPPARAYFKQYGLMSLADTEMMIRNKLKQVVEHWNDPLELIPCCSIEDLFTSKPVYKYYKNGVEGSTRSTKNFDTLAEAEMYRSKNGFKGDIVEDRGKPFMCSCCIPEQVEQMMSSTYKPRIMEIG